MEVSTFCLREDNKTGYAIESASLVVALDVSSK